MSTRIELADEALVVHVEGADRVWALRSRLEVPLSHISGAHRAADEARRWLHGIRLGGTHVPGVISAGRFYAEGQMVFWDVHDPEKAIAVELRDERYSHLVIEVENPDGDIARIEQATARVSA